TRARPLLPSVPRAPRALHVYAKGIRQVATGAGARRPRLPVRPSCVGTPEVDGPYLPSRAQTASAWRERSCCSRAPVGAAMLSEVVTERRRSAVAALHCT